MIAPPPPKQEKLNRERRTQNLELRMIAAPPPEQEKLNRERRTQNLELRMIAAPPPAFVPVLDSPSSFAAAALVERNLELRTEPGGGAAIILNSKFCVLRSAFSIQLLPSTAAAPVERNPGLRTAGGGGAAIILSSQFCVLRSRFSFSPRPPQLSRSNAI
jgi:hypothetical protein